MQFCLDYIINKEKLIDIVEFNIKLKNVVLSARDNNNRPREFKTRKKNQKFEGNAGSLRVLGRILPLVLSEVIDNSLVGQLLIKLFEVSELITALKLTVYEVSNVMKPTIISFLDLRVDAIEEVGMDKLRPKHHYLSHYASLYKFYGPLIHLWALRMESKHQFFKNVIRTDNLCFYQILLLSLTILKT